MNPNSEEFKTLIESHVKIARYMAADFKGKLPAYVDFADLFGAAEQGLVEAANRYDPEAEEFRGIPFLAYARKRIRGAILDSVKRQNFFDSTLQRLSPEAERGLKSLEDPEQMARRAELERAIRSAVEQLDPLAQEILIRKYWLEECGIDLASQVGKSKSRVGQIHREALDQLRPLLKDIMKEPKSKVVSIDRAVIDELGAVQGLIERFEAKPEFEQYSKDLKREKDLKETIKGWIPLDLPGDQETQIEGVKYVVEISARKPERYVKEGGWKKILTWLKDRFFEHCKITLKELEVLLTEDQQQEVITKGHIGSRSITAVPKKERESVRKAA